MFLGKNKQSKPKKRDLLKKLIISTGIVTVLASGIVFAEETGDVATVQHVYVNGKHIGLVSDASIVDKIIQAKLDKAEEKYKDTDLVIGQDVKLVSELAFNPKYNNSAISDYLKDNLTVETESVALKVGNEVVGYFDNKEDADKVLKDYKLKYVDEATLDSIATVKSASLESNGPQIADIPSEPADLAVGESTILDVTLSKEVSLSDEKIDPNKVLSVEDGLKLLAKGTLEEKKHTVQEGEVLGRIASDYDLSLDTLLELNPSITEDSLLQIGQKVNVTELQPFVDVIVKKEVKKKEKIAFKTEVQESDKVFKGEQKVTQQGSDGERIVQYAVEIRNGKVDDRTVLKEEILKEPVEKVIVKGTKVIPSRGTGDLIWPASSRHISSYVGYRWGAYHKGIDISRPSNRRIVAADNGVVVFARYSGGFGNKIEIDHNNGMKTIYAHLAKIQVHVGQVVRQGQQIGIMGSTGDSTGLHLHFEVHKNGVLQNPLDYLD